MYTEKDYITPITDKNTIIIKVISTYLPENKKGFIIETCL